jgi:hypothetical protein
VLRLQMFRIRENRRVVRTRRRDPSFPFVFHALPGCKSLEETGFWLGLAAHSDQEMPLASRFANIARSSAFRGKKRTSWANGGQAATRISHPAGMRTPS